MFNYSNKTIREHLDYQMKDLNDITSGGYWIQKQLNGYVLTTKDHHQLTAPKTKRELSDILDVFIRITQDEKCIKEQVK